MARKLMNHSGGRKLAVVACGIIRSMATDLLLERIPATIGSADTPPCEAYDQGAATCGKRSAWLYLYPPFNKQMFICERHHEELVHDSPFFFPDRYQEIIASCYRIA